MSIDNRYQYLDVLKGVTIFFVVVGHAFHFGFAYYSSPMLTLLRAIDMPIFVFLSGLLSAKNLTWTSSGIGGYWLKKARQLLLPLITLPLLYILMMSIPLKELILGELHGGYWFTWVLFLLFVLQYIIRGVAHLFDVEDSPKAMLILAGLMWGAIMLADNVWYKYALESYKAVTWSKVSFLYPFFLMGFFTGKYPRVQTYLVAPLTQAVAGGILFYAIYHTHQYGYGKNHLLDTLTALVGIIFAYGSAYRLGQSPSGLNNLLAKLGQESRTIYLTHYFFLFSAPMIGTFLRGLRGDRLLMWELGASWLYASLVIALTWLAVRLIKGNPYLSLLCYGQALPSQPSAPTSN